MAFLILKINLLNTLACFTYYLSLQFSLEFKCMHNLITRLVAEEVQISYLNKIDFKTNRHFGFMTHNPTTVSHPEL